MMIEQLTKEANMVPIAATYNGLQECPGRAPFQLWTIEQDIEGHPIHSTVSLGTLHLAGYEPFSRALSQ